MIDTIVNNLIIPSASAFFGALITWIFTNKRKQKAEIVAQELQNQSMAIENWKKLYEETNTKNKDLEDKIRILQKEIDELREQIFSLKKENAELKLQIINLQKNQI